MNYSVSNLNEVADCNVLLSWAAREKDDLNHKRHSEFRLTVKFAETSVEVDAILQGVLAEIAALDIIIPDLPEGKAKDDAEDRLTRAKYKKFVLETRRETYGTIALLQKEMELGSIDLQLEEVDAFITNIEDRKAILEAQA